jgi:hypothetical protein
MEIYEKRFGGKSEVKYGIRGVKRFLNKEK